MAPAMQETRVRALGQEDPLEEGMATRSSIPAWETPWTEEPGGLQSTGLQSVRHDLATKQQWLLLDPTCFRLGFINEVNPSSQYRNEKPWDE